MATFDLFFFLTYKKIHDSCDCCCPDVIAREGIINDLEHSLHLLMPCKVKLCLFCIKIEKDKIELIERRRQPLYHPSMLHMSCVMYLQ